MREAEEYAPASVALQGFVHACGSLEQLLWVANSKFSGADVIVLCVLCELVRAPIRNELGGHHQKFPHIYGPLNLDAVVDVRTLALDSGKGRFIGWA